MLSGGQSGRLQYQLNVTPFIDVMLVLLVIFMLASSAMIADMSINLPSAQSSQDRITIQHETLTVDILKSGDLYVMSRVITSDNDLKSVVEQFKKENEKYAVIINADTDVAYGKVVSVMDVLKRNGIAKVSLATKRDQ